MNPKLKLALGIGLLALSLVLGNTLAANISLNSGGNVEFGQGVALTTACDDEVTVTPYSTFVNETGAGDFIFTNLSVSGISEDCDGKIFTIKAYEDGSDDPLDLYLTNGEDYYNSLEVLFDEGEFTLVDAGLDADDIVTDEGSDADANGFTVTLYTAGPPPSEAVASARDVYRITIESRDNSGSVSSSDGTGVYLLYYAVDPSALSTSSLLAAGERSVMNAVTALNNPIFHNGSYWYYTPGESRGFSLDSTINQNSCDIGVVASEEYRLCWHVDPGFWAVDGYRMGTNQDSNLQRYVFFSNTLPSYYPSGPQLNVDLSTITSGGWTQCYVGLYGDNISYSDVSDC